MLLTLSPPLMSVGSPTEHDRQASGLRGGEAAEKEEGIIVKVGYLGLQRKSSGSSPSSLTAC